MTANIIPPTDRSDDRNVSTVNLLSQTSTFDIDGALAVQSNQSLLFPIANCLLQLASKM